MSPTAIVAYLALFVALGFLFLFVNLLVGKFVRPKAPNVEKLEVYECGEPTIGSSFVQFDLRFYVVALLFIIFDVEIAFFFPWAVVFGKATHLMDPHYQPVVQTSADGAPIGQPGKIELATGTRNTLAALGVPTPALPKPQGDVTENTAAIRDTAASLARTSIVDILVFFAVLLVGFAYVWMRGDLDWVRAVSRQRAGLPLPTPPASDAMEEAALSA
ncbi:MAG TPA: NADH-quinone oxidoreductase subunit A [Pirellulales bacterium]|jgi:NADH-quinone oxidoreductase subunit A|nr:NADH-quinone oxidoreductase subunit A [Pirellulales bacterium]